MIQDRAKDIQSRQMTFSAGNYLSSLLWYWLRNEKGMLWFLDVISFPSPAQINNRVLLLTSIQKAEQVTLCFILLFFLLVIPPNFLL